MSKDRPWNRSPESEPAGQPEPAHILPPLAGLEIHGMNDEQVRAHCLRQARYWLASYEHLRRRNDEHLETATRYAVLADAFRPASTPTEQ